MRISDWSSDVVSSDLVAAMMTGKAARQALLHHPGGTIRALKTITAMPAKRERRITPPIEEQERLFALFQNLIHCPDQLRRYPAAALGRKLGSAHVCTPVTNAHLDSRLLLEKKQH